MALQLRKQGGTYRGIADALRGYQDPETGAVVISEKYSEALAHKDVLDELQRLRDKNSETAGEVRDLEIGRLDEMLQVLWAQVERGDYAAMDRVFRIMERRSRYLGLDTPEDINLNVPNLDALISAGLAKLAGAGEAEDVSSDPGTPGTAGPAGDELSEGL